MRVDVQDSEQAARKEFDAALLGIQEAMEKAPEHWVCCQACGYPEPETEASVSCNEDRIREGSESGEAVCPGCDRWNPGLAALSDVLDGFNEIDHPEELVGHADDYARLARRWAWAQGYRP